MIRLVISILLAGLMACLIPQSVISQEINPDNTYEAFQISDPPIIDGQLTETLWNQGEWQGQFVQFEPNNGNLPRQNTLFKVLFDHNHVYVAMKCFDTAPDSILRRAVRRDYSNGDFAGIAFDSYHDHRTCFVLGADVLGVKYDAIYSNNGDDLDPSWDPIWWVATSESEEGWYLEMKVPFSQLRFEKESQKEWGIMAFRQIKRHDEQDFWPGIDMYDSGFVEHFGHLTGLSGVKPKRMIDLLPYGVLQYDNYPKEAGNPFKDGSDLKPRLGLDGKIGITNNMTLNLTVNPDFGQVEADPSRVNLTAFETFYQEKRPFFVEGSNITQFGIGDGDGGIGNDNLFYSRRIGRKPHYQYPCSEGEYINSPQFTPILGAVKLTGKTADGLSIGLIESITGRVESEVFNGADTSLIASEPTTNYLIGRVQKDINKGNTMIGGILTSTNRFIQNDHLNGLVSNALTGGVDFTQYIDDRSWRIRTNTAFSHISGSKKAILNAQTSSARYFQRPDAQHVAVDSSMQSLTGSGGRIELDKLSGHWNIHMGFLWKSPQFEVNDLGFMHRADQMTQILAVEYREWQPSTQYQSFEISMNQYTAWNFGGMHMGNGYAISGHMVTPKRWDLALSLRSELFNSDDALLRGGPLVKLPGRVGVNLDFNTDSRKKLLLGFNGDVTIGLLGNQINRILTAQMILRVTERFEIRFFPAYHLNYNQLQYVKHQKHHQSDLYIFSSIDQQMLSLPLRFNFVITPNLTIQYWGQPFFASARFYDFKYITDPDASEYENRFSTYLEDQVQIEADDYIGLDHNRDGQIDFGFQSPDFTISEFLSNLVVRWEYLPGSSLYLVWSQQSRVHSNLYRKFETSDIEQMVQGVHNYLQLKVSYRVGQ